MTQMLGDGAVRVPWPRAPAQGGSAVTFLPGLTQLRVGSADTRPRVRCHSAVTAALRR